MAPYLVGYLINNVGGTSTDSDSDPHALLEYDQGITPYSLEPSTSPWETLDIFEYGDDVPTPPHILAITVNDIGENNPQLLRGELISILQLMVNRMGEEGHENDAIVPVSPIKTCKGPLYVLSLTRTRC